MNEYFILQSTSEVILEFSTNTRPVRIEIFSGTENKKKLKAKVWDQNTYNMYPTFANMKESGGIENRLMSSDEVNREITTLLSDDPNDLFYGKEWESEEQYLFYIKGLIEKYHGLLKE